MYVIASYCLNCMLQLLCELAYLKKLTWSGPGFLNPPTDQYKCSGLLSLGNIIISFVNQMLVSFQIIHFVSL